MLRRLLQRNNTNNKTKTAQPTAAAPSLPADPVERARSATNNKVRTAAVAEITSLDTLQQLAQSEPLTNCCADRLVELDELAAALSLASTTEARIELAIACHQPALKDALIAELRDEQSLLELERRSRNRNKPSNRAARTALETLRDARTSAAEAAQLSITLNQQVERLDNDAHLQARYDTLKAKWQSALSQWQQALQVLAHHQETPPAFSDLPDCPTTQSSATTSTSDIDFAGLAQAFAGVRGQLAAGAAAAELRDTIGDLSKRWHEGIKQATPEPKIIDEVKTCTDLFETALGAQQRWAELQGRAQELLTQTEASAVTDSDIDFANAPLNALPNMWPLAARAAENAGAIKTLLKDLRWPNNLPSPDPLDGLSQRRTALQQVDDAARTRQQSLEADLGKRLNRATRSLASGHAQDAERTHQHAQLLIDALPEDAAPRLQAQFATLQEKLQQVRDWQQFATDPKRDELVAAMEALANNPVNPVDQASEVKALRAQWRELGSLGPQELADRFEQAAEKAFEPARQHFADQAQVRADNLQQRQAIVTQLEEYLASTDWTNADMSAAQGILNTAREAWRAAFPVERGPNRAIEKQFTKATDTLYEKLRAFWDQNLEAKTSLVNQAQALLSDERPLPERLNDAKSLQANWKNSGSAPRGQEQRLWKDFRKACDELFGQRDQQRQAEVEQRQAITTAITERIAAFAAELNAQVSPSEIARNHFANFESELTQLGSLDHGQRKQLNELKAQCDAMLRDQASRAAVQSLDALRQADRQCAECELGDQPIAVELLEAHPILRKREVAPQHAAHDLVLEAEWLAQIDPPAADRQRRMELQVSWMNQGMNAGARLEADPMKLAQRWCQYRATEDSAQLGERLFAACAQLLAASN